MTQLINPQKFTHATGLLRSFFLGKGFEEVHTQNRLSILAACEDPFNVATFNYASNTWPLPQTGQMWLEYEILKNPSAKGFYCITTSYRQEDNPVDGRHDIIFPLFEFEMRGDMEELIKMEQDLLEHLGYSRDKFQRDEYRNIANDFSTTELEHEHETKLHTDRSATYFITDFPEFTDPFWNMKRSRSNDTSHKVDVILSGQETIGSAEREVDKKIMFKRFQTIMNGKYKDKMYELFTEQRTDQELQEYFDFDFFTRCGGGIGVTRLMRSMEKEGLI